MSFKALLTIALVADSALAYPWVAKMPGVDTTLIKTELDRKRADPIAGSAATCPYNSPSKHVPAVPFNSKYPYNSAKNGLPGKGIGGYYVPAKGDKAHYFVAPNPKTDIRGPCPGLNAAANHNFLAHDGITNIVELVDAQQNLFNVGYDLAVILAVLGLTTTDGDIVTEKLSIGCDATTRTSVSPLLTGSEPGLDGHNKFEADSSLTRNDYFTHNGDNFNFNGTLFGQMTKTTGGIYDIDGLSKYRYERYHQSLADNKNFYFGPFSLLLYGAASFLYELMPSGPDYTPDFATISSFFGAQKQTDGSYKFNNAEKIPDNWTTRKTPYTGTDVGLEIVKMYALNPVLFGGNTGDGTFDFITTNDGLIKDGKLTSNNPANVVCFLYQLTTERIPSSLNSIVGPTVAAIEFAVSKLGSEYENLGCALPLSKRDELWEQRK